jgi:tetratricopeptide (TPR) repeat protein
VSGRLLRFPGGKLSSEQAERAAERIFATPFEDRADKKRTLHLEDPETLLTLCGILRDRITSSPSTVHDEAEFLYRFLESPKRDIGLFDERDYFLGETALIAGASCRYLSRREESWIWFDRSEANFRHTMNAAADLSRLGYQRLAERLEERQITLVLELLPPLIASFERLGMAEDALKCRFLEGLAFLESGQPAEAATAFQSICAQAEALGSRRLLAEAYVNLTQVHAMLGEADEAIQASSRAVPLLRELGNQISLAKIQWGLGMLLRETEQIPEAIVAFRSAQAEFGALGLRADTAALNLVLADLLLDQGQNIEALREIASALPVIDELKMAPEGMAALSLLRESALRQQINRAALRELHGYFPQPDA